MSTSDNTNAPNSSPSQSGASDAIAIERKFLNFAPDPAGTDSHRISGYDVGQQTLNLLHDEYMNYLQGPMEANQTRATWAVNKLKFDEMGNKATGDPGFGPDLLDSAAAAWLYDNGLGNFGKIQFSTVETLRNQSNDPVESALNNLLADKVESEPLFIDRSSVGGPMTTTGVSETTANTVLGYAEGTRELELEREQPKSGGGITGWLRSIL